MKTYKMDNVKVIVVEDYTQLSITAAEIVATIIKKNPSAKLGLATGSSPIGLYKELIRMSQKGEISFEAASTYNLDEYYPIEKKSDQSYDYFMKHNLFNHIDINIENTHIPNGMAKNSTKESEAYERLVRETGGVDIQVLGIGSNGHIGFNEPSEVFEPATHRVQLDERTIKDNARFFESIEEVPTEAITMGIGTIMSAKSILLLATGEGKAPIIKEMLLGKITPKVQASVLQFHQNVTIILDYAAAKELLKEIEK
ncbi:MAG: glucosamine-6-phosphate deaminase [Cellulosilyticaceae bacterium]